MGACVYVGVWVRGWGGEPTAYGLRMTPPCGTYSCELGCASARIGVQMGACGGGSVCERVGEGAECLRLQNDPSVQHVLLQRMHGCVSGCVIGWGGNSRPASAS